MHATLPATWRIHHVEAGRLSRALPLVLVGAAVLAIVTPMLSAQFGMFDDHEIVAMTGADGRLWPWEWPGIVVQFAMPDGVRFRPFYYVLRATEAMLWGESPAAWYLCRMGLALAAAGCAVALLRRLPPLPTAAVTLMLLAGPQAEAFFRLGPQEAYALPLFLGGILLLQRRRPWLAVALLVAAGLTKESFAVALPVVVFSWWWIERHWTRPLVVLAVATAALVAGVAVTQLMSNVYGMQRTLPSIAMTAVTMLLLPAVTTGWILPAMAAIRRSSRLLVAAALLLASQVVVYGAFGLDLAGHYLALPVVALMAVAAAGFVALPKRVAEVVAVGMLLLMVPAIAGQHARADLLAEGTRSFHSWMADVAAYPGPISVTTAPQDAETVISIQRYLDAYGHTSSAAPCAEVVIAPAEATGACAKTISWPAEKH